MKNIRLKNIRVANIGPFEELNVQLNPTPDVDKAEVHIFTGNNGTGKSTLLRVMTAHTNQEFFLRSCAGVKGPNVAALDYDIKGRSDRYVITPDTDKRSLMIEITGQAAKRYLPNVLSVEKYFSYNNSVYEKYESYSEELGFAAFAYSGHRSLSNGQIVSIEEFEGNPLQHALNFESPVETQKIVQWVANNKTKHALELAKNDLVSAEKYRTSVLKLEVFVSEVTGLKIEFDIETNPLNVVIKVDDVPLSFSLLPDGLKSIISWVGDLLMRMDRLKWKDDTEVFQRNFMLFLDEIEVHLHPAWQRKILPVIQKIFPNAQIFISTHSPFVVGSVDNAWIYKFKKKGQYSVLDGEPVLSEDSNSYRQILRNVFDIQQQFGVAVEAKMTRFYTLKNSILKNELLFDDAEFQQLIDDFAGESVEVQNIIGMELKQMKRLLGMNEAAV